MMVATTVTEWSARYLGSLFPGILGLLILVSMRRRDHVPRSTWVMCWLLIAGAMMELTVLVIAPPRPGWLRWWFCHEGVFSGCAWLVGGCLFYRFVAWEHSWRCKAPDVAMVFWELSVIPLLIAVLLSFGLVEFQRVLRMKLASSSLDISKHDMVAVWKGQKGVPQARFPVSFAPEPRCDKEYAGDGKTPRNTLYVREKSPTGSGGVVHLDYPNEGHAPWARGEGLITWWEWLSIWLAVARREMPPQNTHLGGGICIHSRKTRHECDGCIILQESDMKRLFDGISEGASVWVQE